MVGSKHSSRVSLVAEKSPHQGQRSIRLSEGTQTIVNERRAELYLFGLARVGELVCNAERWNHGIHA